jgi:NAD(P)-dependent dehydrogenase (short-subunit alcohol dehydrogenase family)
MPRLGGRLDGKVAIVTGGGRGIGAAITRKFAEEGAAVAAVQRTLEDCERLAHDLQKEGRHVIALAADVSDEASVQQMVARVVENLGRIDILCNNAGIGGVAGLLELRMAYYEEVMNTNVRGLLLCMKHSIPSMLDHGAGSVINIASICSYVGLPRSIVYCASKGAVVMATRQAALDFAESGVRVNAIAPGFIGNEMFRAYCDSQEDPQGALNAVLAQIPMRRLGEEDDIAAAATFFASDESRWITGSTLVVDGGTLCQ